MHGSGAAGVSFATIRDASIYAPNIGIYMRSEAGSLVNGNAFENILMERPSTSIRLEH